MGQRRRFVVLSLVSLLWMTSCSGEPAETEPSPVVSSSPTEIGESTPDPSPTAEPTDSGDEGVPEPEPLPLPDVPDDLAPEDTAENAIRAAEYFVDLINYMLSTGDTTQFQALSIPVCEPCERIVKLQHDRQDKNGYLVGNLLSFEGLEAERTTDDLAWVVHGDLETSDGFEVIDGDVENHVSALQEKGYRIAVQLVDGTWMLLTFASAVREE